jgi:ubiquinone/menaquinone biosynthesis C-methylase UbiE
MMDGKPYTVIAPFYDWMMSHVDYKTWAEYIRAVWVKNGIQPGKILELAAGTCPFQKTNLFPANAWVVQTDVSYLMLRHSKCGRQPPRLAADVVRLPIKGLFDACIMIYDAINYLAGQKMLETCFNEVHRILAPEGLFIFDVTTEHNSMTYFQDNIQLEERHNCTLVRHSWYEKKKKIQHNRLINFIIDQDGRYTRLEEHHEQTVYSISQITSGAVKAGFTLAGCYGDFTFEPPARDSERIHFVLRK